MNLTIASVKNKAESLQYTSVGHRPTEWKSRPSQALKGRNKFLSCSFRAQMGVMRILYPRRCHWAELFMAFSHTRQNIIPNEVRNLFLSHCSIGNLRKEVNMDNPVQTKCSAGYINLSQSRNYVVVQLLTELFFCVVFTPSYGYRLARGYQYSSPTDLLYKRK